MAVVDSRVRGIVPSDPGGGAMDQIELRVPESQRSAFSSLAALSDESLGQLLDGLRDLAPSVFFGSSSKRLAERAGLDVSQVAPILIMISSLFSLREQYETTFEDLKGALLDAVESDPEISLDDAGRARLDHFLATVFELDNTLGVTSKAWTVTRDFERIYCHSRVLTDLRPVFRPGTTSPAALVVVHNLKVAYHEGETLKEVFVGLTRRDLDRLKATVERAIEKENNLSESLSTIDLPLLEVE
ncbi:MAG TPA: hypothetical protein VLF66_04185 [Thermoanaerobaculia bacterium]|nr:hypothetical protein [Thermoanaerobaculia bacterium]